MIVKLNSIIVSLLLHFCVGLAFIWAINNRPDIKDAPKLTKLSLISANDNIIAPQGVSSKNENAIFSGFQQQSNMDQSQKEVPIGQAFSENDILTYRPEAKLMNSTPPNDSKLPKEETFNSNQLDESSKFTVSIDDQETIEQQNQQIASETSSLSGQKLKNLESRAEIRGGFQLSSYEWEYAPYMNEWIQKIQKAWIPPISFLAGHGRGGRVVVDVMIDKSGKMLDMKVLYRNVNEDMTTSAKDAVLRTFKLQPLPEQFPDSTLSVIFNMIYNID